MNYTKYDREYFNPNAKPSDEMTTSELAIWITAIGITLGSIVFMWITS